MIIFFNDLSLDFHASECNDIDEATLVSIKALLQVNKLRSDLKLFIRDGLSSITIGAERKSLASVISPKLYQPEWGLLKRLVERENFNFQNMLVTADEEIHYNGNASHMMTLAYIHNSLIWSFGFHKLWKEGVIDAERYSINNDKATNCQINNISLDEHVTLWRDQILNYGHVVSTSSIISERLGVVIRMFFNDHPPPHIHILENRNTNVSLAKYRIDTCECTWGNPGANKHNDIVSWIEMNRVELLTNWERCRKGEHPRIINT